MVKLSQAHWKGKEGFRGGEGTRLRRERAGGRGQGLCAGPQWGLAPSNTRPGPSAAAYSSASAEPCPFLFRPLSLRSFFAVCPAL